MQINYLHYAVGALNFGELVHKNHSSFSSRVQHVTRNQKFSKGILVQYNVCGAP